jgi:hypothetical protein
MGKYNDICTLMTIFIFAYIIYYLTKNDESKEILNNSKKETFCSGDSCNIDNKTVSNDNIPSITKDQLQQLIEEPVTNDTFNIFDFKPMNTSEINENGVDLDNAFQEPSPNVATSDSVNINKNNQTKYNAKDFLPKEINTEWFDTDFSQAKYNIKDDKLINTERYIIGINTVGQSLKNASYDIRGTVPNPKFAVSPWNNSTYEADHNIKSLC